MEALTQAFGSIVGLDNNARSTQEDDKYTVMLEWLAKGGCTFPHLSLETYADEYRGIHAASSIQEDTCIVRVTPPYIMTTELAKDSPIGRRIRETNCQITSKHSYLATFLLYEREKGTSSFFHPYIVCLPCSYNNMPTNFTPEEKSYLKGSFSLEKISQRVESLEHEYNIIVGAIPEFARFSLEDFTWARHVVITRIFGVVVRGLKTEGLVPVADLLNHKRPRQTKWCYDNSEKAFTITTLCPLAKGAAIYDSYGRKCNSRFFVNYGFSLEENEDNEVVLSLAIDTADPSAIQKSKLIGDIQKSFQVPSCTRDKKTKELLSFARFISLSSKELERFPTSYSFVLEDIPSISIHNELAALQLVRDASFLVLSGFETTESEDTALLEKDLSMNIRNAVLMRRGEKQVCQSFIDLVDKAIPLFGLNLKEFDDLHLHRSDSRLGFYAMDVVRPLIRRSGII